MAIAGPRLYTENHPSHQDLFNLCKTGANKTLGLSPSRTQDSFQMAVRRLSQAVKELNHGTEKTNKKDLLVQSVEKFFEITKSLKNPESKKTDIDQLKKDFKATLHTFEQAIDAGELLAIQKNLLDKLSVTPEKNIHTATNEDLSLERVVNDTKSIKKKLLAAFAATEPGHKHAHGHAHGHDHDHSDGVVIDLDEAVHGVYASTKYIISALKGNPQHILDEFSREANELANNTWTYLRDELVPHGIGEFAAGVGVSAIMLPLAYMAAKAGLEEMHHASHEIKELKKHQGTLKNIQVNLEEMNGILESNYLKTEAQVVGSKANVIQRAVKQSKRDWKIGLCSFGSGVSIGTKALSDIGLKISLGVQGLLTGKGFLAGSQVISASTPTALVTTVLGAVGTFMMGPLAGLFATGLGAYFTRKSTSKRNQLKTDFKMAAGQLGLDPKTGKTQANSAKDSFKTYQDFMGRQGKRRISFFKGFTRWNKAFMIGSGLYAASATTKAVVAGLALGGLTAAASNPIGLGVITAVGTIGALGMGIASYCFITGHGKQGKYAKHTAGDDKLVDRDLLVRAQAHAVDQNTSLDIKEQVKLATACLTRLNARKDAIRTFLKAAATSSTTKKKISPFAVTKDGKKEKDENGNTKIDPKTQLTLWKRLKGQRLSVKDVEKYMESSEAPNKIIEFAQKDLAAEATYLQEQLNTIKVLIDQAKDTQFNPGQTDENKSLPATQQFKDYTDEQLSDKYEAIHARLQATNELKSQLNKATYKEYLLKHWGVEAKEGKENHALADYLLDDVDKELRNARGVLFEAQLQASQLVPKTTTLGDGGSSNSQNKTAITSSSSSEDIHQP